MTTQTLPAPLDALDTHALRVRVEAAIYLLGNGFLAHASNGVLGAQKHDPNAYFSEVARVVFRLLFTLANESHALGSPNEQGHSAVSLKSLLASARPFAARPAPEVLQEACWSGSHDASSELWRALRAQTAKSAAFSVSEFFELAELPDIVLLAALAKLGLEPATLQETPWSQLPVECFGHIYETLLDAKPVFTSEGYLSFSSTLVAAGSRRSRGSYYTPDELIQVVLDAALQPIVAEHLAQSATGQTLLQLRLVDPACGCGHFLLGAARRLAQSLAQARCAQPGDAEYRAALSDVVTHCIYGVDLDPLALEICEASLQLEVTSRGLPCPSLGAHLRLGNTLLGATPQMLDAGIPNAAWLPRVGEDRRVCGALRRQNRKAPTAQDLPSATPQTSNPARTRTATSDLTKFLADAWCAAFFWPRQVGAENLEAPLNPLWQSWRAGTGRATTKLVRQVNRIARSYAFFHWHLEFPEILAAGGFDVVLGNPPWIAHAGRAAQPLPVGVKHFYEVNYEAFADYPTTHGLFVSVVPRFLRPGGRLGFVVPSSLSELGGYEPTRRAHDRLCDFPAELLDFGEGRFEGVTQPCMALISLRNAAGRLDASGGSPWPIARPDLSETDRALLARLSTLPTLPRELFGERGVQSDRSLSSHFRETGLPIERFTTPVREGADIREFELLAPRFHVDPEAIGARIRPSAEFEAVRFLVRQTARYPIAALSDGKAFRNSLLAGFETHEWPAAALVALLNSALMRWFHFMRNRDARQPILPQVKVAHLRSVPVSPGLQNALPELADLGLQMSRSASLAELPKLRRQLDSRIATLYELTPAEQESVSDWHERHPTKTRNRTARAPQRTEAISAAHSTAQG